MQNGDLGPSGPGRAGHDSESVVAEPASDWMPGSTAEPTGSVIMTEVSPFHCLYQDALEFHSQSRLMLGRSVSGSSRLARAALLLYVASGESLVHQAAVELGRPEFIPLLADPSRPMRLEDALRLLPAIVAKGSGLSGDLLVPPWPQFGELLALRTSWAYPGPSANRRAYYRAPAMGAEYEPMQPHQVPPGLNVASGQLQYPRTGLPRDPYALRPHHLDTTRGILDAMVESLDRRLDGSLTRDNRHRREPVRIVYPPTDRIAR
ncbi:hypothetical protein P12x_001668 [Tundrisphaera lichenicola]|uniref:hypothetical protein n=1 Tax=Tundrisphaera lichenicola TaxID=2029860 RepID=UPI003EB73ECE